MKQKLFLNSGQFFFLLILLNSCTSLAQGTIEKEEVSNALQQFDQAMIDRNSEVLDSLTSKKLSYGHSSGNIQNKEQFLDDAVNGPFQFVSITNKEQNITLSENVGVVRYILTADAFNAGNPTNIRIGILMVFQKNNDNKIVLLARQAYKL